MGKKNKSPEMPAPEVVIEQAEMPTRPPVQEERGRPEGLPASPPVQGEPTDAGYENSADAKEKKSNNPLKVALIVGGLAIVTAVAVRGCADDKDSTPTGGTTTTVVENPAGPQSESCPEGIFTKENPYAAAAQVKPGSLMRNPESALKNKEQAYAYLMGDKNEEIQGELCALPSSVATFETIFNGWVGEGSAQARPFGSFTQDANELNAFYASNPEKAEQILDNKVFKSFVDSFDLNEKAIKGGAYYKIALLGDKIVQEPIQLGDLEAGSVFQLEGDVWYSDTKFTGTQVAIMDKEGNVFVRQSIGGVPMIAPTPEATTTSTTAPANTDSWSATPGNTSGNGNSNTSGNTNGGGNGGGGTGGNGGGGTGGNGGGGTGGNGGGGTGGNGGGTPTTIYYPPTTTRPPVTTVPPAPTRQSKGPEVTILGAPN
jgi:hypothetical protein